MRCPFKLLHAPYDGGARCDMECAWLVDVYIDDHWSSVCAVALIDADKVPRIVVNRVDDE